MSVKERPKKKKIVTNKSEDSVELSESTIIEKEVENKEISKNIDEKMQQFIANIPMWVNKPFMYIKPSHPGLLNSWLDSWESLIMDYARTLKIHIINIIELQSIYPFYNKKINKKLSKSNITYIFENMETKGVVRWIDENHILVRIYYKTLEEWKNIIIKYLFDTGMAAEILTIYELENTNQEWSNLPREDLIYIIESMVKDGVANWVGKSKDAISINI